MTSRKKIYYLYWSLPIVFLLWELFCEYMPLVRELIPLEMRKAIFGSPRSLAEAIAFKLIPFAYIVSTIWKYGYITVCYLLRRRSVVVLIITILSVVIFTTIDCVLYRPFEMELPYGTNSTYQIRLFNFIVGIITYCPFYLCVYFLIKRMDKADSMKKP